MIDRGVAGVLACLCMAIRTIVTYPSSVLKERSREVEALDDEVRRLLDDMADTMYHAGGVGLAAPQVGVPLRCIVIDVGSELPDGRVVSNLISIVNPVITSSEGRIEWEEGCLSVPDLLVKMERASKVSVRGLDRDGKPIELEAEGLLAVAFQHEIDHLDGKLIIDKVSALERDLYLKGIRKKAKVL